MNETQLKELLAGTDQAFAAESTGDPAALAKNAQRRVAIRRKRRAELFAGGTMVLLLTSCLIGYMQFSRYQKKKQAALRIEIQNDLADLKAQTQHTLALIQSVNERTRKQKQLTSLQRRLASLTAQTEDTESVDEQLAGELYQKAQSLSAQADSCNAVKILYQQILRTFPNSSYVSSAKENLAQLNCPNGISL